MADNVWEDFGAAIEWADAQAEYASPFDNQEFVNSYFAGATDLFDEAEEMMEAGNANNTHSDSQGLVTVIYAVVLFLLGIAASFKTEKVKKILLTMSVVGFVGATIVMFTIPITLPV